MFENDTHAEQPAVETVPEAPAAEAAPETPVEAPATNEG